MDRGELGVVGYPRVVMRRLILAAVLVNLLASSQTDFSGIRNLQAGATAVAAARTQLAGRTDPEAIAQWERILDEMHLAGDPDLKSVVQSLRALNLYDNESWIRAIDYGYAYLSDEEGERRFSAELSVRRPDSERAIRTALRQWEVENPALDPTDAGLVNWQLARLAFLKHLHELRPHSEAALAEYLNMALLVESVLPTKDAVEVAELASASPTRSPADLDFSLAELYLHHRTHLDRIPGLLDKALEATSYRASISSETAEIRKRRLAEVHMRVDRDLAEYWFEKNDLRRARSLVAQVGSSLSFLVSTADGQSGGAERLEEEQKLWLALAKRVGVEVKPALFAKNINLINLNDTERTPLGNFDVIDVSGHRWTLLDLRGKAALVTTWATWCAPCRAELPYIQKLHEAFRGRNDRLVITLNVDSSEELARRFVRDYNYTFPVICSSPLAARINFDVGVPQNRLIDPQTRVLSKPISLDGDASISMLEALMSRLE